MQFSSNNSRQLMACPALFDSDRVLWCTGSWSHACIMYTDCSWREHGQRSDTVIKRNNHCYVHTNLRRGVRPLETATRGFAGQPVEGVHRLVSEENIPMLPAPQSELAMSTRALRTPSFTCLLAEDIGQCASALMSSITGIGNLSPFQSSEW